MRIELVKRPEQSKLFSALSPLIAFGLTVLAGAILFALLGKDPVLALYTYFIEPLTEVWSLHELMIKAAPLILIAVGLSVCFVSNNWNIGAEGQFVMGAIVGSLVPGHVPGFPEHGAAADHAGHGRAGRCCLRLHPSVPQGKIPTPTRS